MTCGKCRNKLSPHDYMDELVLWNIPFTRIEIRVWRWYKKPVCVWCEGQQDRENYEAAADAACEVGYQEGYRDAEDKHREF